MKKLYLLRHAKSSWKDSTLHDLDRPLNKRGLRNAPQMGQRLAAKNTVVDRLISSPALRALTTARLIAAEIGFDQQRIAIENALYFQGSLQMLNVIRAQDETVDSVMLVSHNPDLTALLNTLCGFQTQNMPTAAIAEIEIHVPWQNAGNDAHRVLSYDFPKNSTE